MSHWNIEQIPSQSGKVAIVTGANSGIGYETSLALARKDVTVIMACRNLQKGEAAKKKILKTYADARLTVMQLDVARLKSVEKFVQDFKAHFDSLNLLINNAGIMMSPYQQTEDGFENQLATNYTGHFALTGHLLPLMEDASASRIVSLSSLSYKWAEIDFENLHAEKGYSKNKAYGQSKRACLVFAYELQRRMSEAGYQILSVAAHPGLSQTNLDRYFPKLIRPLGALFLQSPGKGALPVLYAALEESLRGGEYIGPGGFQEMRGNPKVVGSDANSKNREIGKHLWQRSEEMTQVHYLGEKARK
jgi:NAD(P)-dependent dehydrogenase (short-subunit alcohol dehydrogenase family)